jgi:hypothetical protein
MPNLQPEISKYAVPNGTIRILKPTTHNPPLYKYPELGIEAEGNKTEFDAADPPIKILSHGF